MTYKEQLTQLLSDLRAKQRVAEEKAHDELTRAGAYQTAALMVEDALDKLNKRQEAEAMKGMVNL